MTETKNIKPTERDIIREVMSLSLSVVKISGVIQTSGSFVVNRIPDPTEKIAVNLQEFEPATDQNENVLSVRIRYGFEGRVDSPASVSADSLFNIEAEFQVDYELNKNDLIPSDTLAAFGDTNSRINLTAYWREWVSSCLSRAQLPGYLVPPLNAQSRFDHIRKQFAKAQAENSKTESDDSTTTAE